MARAGPRATSVRPACGAIIAQARQEENSGKMDIITFDGAGLQNAVVKTIKEGLVMTPAVTATRGMAWVVEGKLPYMNDAAYKDKDPGLFKLYAVPLPKN
jgi:hypothetical protein